MAAVTAEAKFHGTETGVFDDRKRRCHPCKELILLGPGNLIDAWMGTQQRRCQNTTPALPLKERSSPRMPPAYVVQ
jgi:hypothetical protein